MFSRDCALILHSFQSLCSWLAEKRKWFFRPRSGLSFSPRKTGLAVSSRVSPLILHTPILSHSPGGNKQMLIVVPGHTRSATIWAPYIIGHSMEARGAPWRLMRLHGGPWRSPWRSVEAPWRSVEVSIEICGALHRGPWRSVEASMEVRGGLY